ncbi:hypothetical protein DQ238_09810 [Geodermatophilus sp. TF02-6]|nr:hypothetical protein DQ238_09810 [Geodermatophilus sp. TF02-6]
MSRASAIWPMLVPGNPRLEQVGGDGDDLLPALAVGHPVFALRCRAATSDPAGLGLGRLLERAPILRDGSPPTPARKATTARAWDRPSLTAGDAPARR